MNGERAIAFLAERVGEQILGHIEIRGPAKRLEREPEEWRGAGRKGIRA